MHEVKLLAEYNQDGQQIIDEIGFTTLTRYKDLRREIVAYICDDFHKEFKLWAILAGWIIPPKTKTIEEYVGYLDIQQYSGFMRSVYQDIVNSGIDPVFLSKLFKARRIQSLEFERIYLNLLSRDFANIEAFIPQKITDILGFDCRNEIVTLINATWGNTYGAGSVNIGKGEVCLTIITGAVKSKQGGDLCLPQYSQFIEVKGAGGRLGPSTSNGFLTRTAARLANITNQTSQQLIFDIHKLIALQNKHEEVNQYREEYREYREILHGKRRKAKIQLDKAILQREILDKNLTKPILIQKQSYQLLSAFLQNVGETSVPDKLAGCGVSVRELGKLKELYNKWKIAQKYDISSYEFSSEDVSFSHLVKGYFILLENKLSSLQKISGFFSCRNIEGDSEYQEYLKHLIEDLFSKIPVQFLSNQQQLSKLFITLHSSCYWMESRFTHLQCFNDRTRDTCIINFPKRTGTLLTDVYSKIPDNLSTRFAIGEGLNPVGVKVYVSSH